MQEIGRPKIYSFKTGSILLQGNLLVLQLVILKLKGFNKGIVYKIL